MDMQKHYEKIAEKIDDWDKMDRKFILWYILKNYYIPEVEKELKIHNFENAKSKNDCMIVLQIVNQLKALREMENILLYDIF